MTSADGRKTTRGAEGTYRAVHTEEFAPPDTTSQETLCICLVGGKCIYRYAIQALLEGDRIEIAESFADTNAFVEAAEAGLIEDFDVIVLISAAGCFSSFHRFGDLISQGILQTPVAVLSDDLSRGSIYSAVRMGAKAYVTLDSQPEELTNAIQLAADGKLQLSRDAAEVMLTDLTGTSHGQAGSTNSGNAELSTRETEVVQLLCEGLSSKKIALRLHVSPKTVENHRYNIYRKCHVESIAGLIRHAVQHGIVSL